MGASSAELAQLEAALEALGCPSAKVSVLATQLDKRARQLSKSNGKSYGAALTHLLGLMKQGWVAQENAGLN